MPLLSLCRKGREIVCWAFVLCWIFGLRAKPLDQKLPPPIPPHYKVVAGSKWAAFFVIGPLLRVIAIEHPRWEGLDIFVIIAIIVALLSWSQRWGGPSFTIGPLLRVIAIEHPSCGIFIFVILVLLSWSKRWGGTSFIIDPLLRVIAIEHLYIHFFVIRGRCKKKVKRN